MFMKRTWFNLCIEKITLADARVACPHNGISILGEKYRIAKALPDSRGERKAVSERFNSCAICNILSSLNCESTRQTPAGLPLNGVSVKASTIKILTLGWSILFLLSCVLATVRPVHTRPMLARCRSWRRCGTAAADYIVILSPVRPVLEASFILQALWRRKTHIDLSPLLRRLCHLIAVLQRFHFPTRSVYRFPSLL